MRRIYSGRAKLFVSSYELSSSSPLADVDGGGEQDEECGRDRDTETQTDRQTDRKTDRQKETEISRLNEQT